MCVMDTRERALIRQSGLPEIILSAKYPVCVRTESGKFIDSNSVFLHLIKCQNSNSEIWFSGIDWICPYISRHLLSLNPLLARCRRYSRGER